MRSKRSREGEIVIDHRASPGLTPAQVAGFAPAVAKGELYESAVVVCGHCDAAVILEPKRTRDRGWCPKCDRYTCDDCEALRAKTASVGQWNGGQTHISITSSEADRHRSCSLGN